MGVVKVSDKYGRSSDVFRARCTTIDVACMFDLFRFVGFMLVAFRILKEFCVRMVNLKKKCIIEMLFEPQKIEDLFA